MADYKEENSYRTILRRISAFGGVQLFNILISLVRGKFVALFLGPSGMGVSALFTSSTTTIQQFASLGINLALVKEVAAEKDNPARLPHVMAVTLRLILLTSILGAAVCALGAPFWSLLTFGDYSYTIPFILLALSVALSIAGAGYLAILQGLGSVSRLAKSSLVGGLAGLFCGVPLYWLFGVDGIVPAMIILSLATFLFYYISFRTERRPEAERVAFSWRQHAPLVKKLITFGLLMMVASLAGTTVNYLINLFVRSFGSVSDVGLFQAANSLTNQYMGVVFSALAMDYFPRLSAVASDGTRLKEVVNRQVEIVMLIATPLALLLTTSAPLIIRILLTSEFLPVLPVMRWMGLGILIQALAFPIGYIYIAREDRKAYIWMEAVMTNIIWFLSSAGFYYFLGLIGLGVSLVARGALELAINYLVCRHRYGFTFSPRIAATVAISLTLGTCGFAVSLSSVPAALILSLSILALSLLFSLFRLRRLLKQC